MYCIIVFLHNYCLHYSSYIVTVSFIGGENPTQSEEKERLSISQCQTL